jgi:hydroxypyruvate reductase
MRPQLNYDSPVHDLLDVYRRTLDRCGPDRLIARVADSSMPRDVVAIGKCAGLLFDGFARTTTVHDALVAIPDGYRRPVAGAEVVTGGHPDITPASFAAGKRVLEFVDAHDDVTFLISGGGSACIEQPLAPWFTESDLTALNRRLVASGLTIGEINCVRKHVSAIKGGRLGARVRGRSVTLIYSDVSDGAFADVASGPTLPDETTKEEATRLAGIHFGPDVPETVRQIANMRVVLVADNSTLTSTAAELIGAGAVPLGSQLESDVEVAAAELFERAQGLQPGQVLVAGGEPTVIQRGRGRGGRCTELAVRFALRAVGRPWQALFASSDGVDGSSGAAGVVLRGIHSFDESSARDCLARSDSAKAAETVGELIMMPPTGNNLRDLFLLART